MDKLAFLIMLASFSILFMAIKIKDFLLLTISLILFIMSIFLFLLESRMI